MAVYVAAIDGMTSHDAADATSLHTSLISQEGVVLQTGTDLAVSAQDTPDMTVKVAKGSCYVLRDAHVDADNSLKFWHVIVTASTNVTITANSSGSTRVDRICVKIDTGATPTATASNVATLVAVAGTPGAGAPTVPNNHLGLAQVSVSDGETTIDSGDITDERTFIGLVLPYAHGYRLTDTGGNLDAQVYEDATGKVFLKSVRSGVSVGLDPITNRIDLSHDGNLPTGGNFKVNDLNPYRTIVLPAQALSPTTTSPCADIATVEAGTNDVDYKVLDFDKTTAEMAFVVIAMPDSWDGGTIKFRTVWTSAGGSADQTFILGMKGRAFANDDAIDQAYGSEVKTTDALIATGDVHISAASAAVTLDGTPAGGQLVQLKLTRDVADTLDDDARLIAIIIEYQVSQYSD